MSHLILDSLLDLYLVARQSLSYDSYRNLNFLFAKNVAAIVKLAKQHAG